MLRRWLRRPLLRRHRTAPPAAAVTARHTAGNRVTYSPQLDGAADPGEIVWSTVAYEDQPFLAKDRPVLIVGRRNKRTVLGLMLSSQDHTGDPHWHALGAGTWDKRNRPSWIRLDRILELHENGLRREAAVLDRVRFEQVAVRLRRDYGWH